MKKFFSDLCAKIKADAINAGALISTALGNLLAHIDDLAAELGDPHLTEQIKNIVHADAKMIGHWMTLVGIVTIVARFKKLVQSPKA